jgi:hypothetical protein
VQATVDTLSNYVATARGLPFVHPIKAVIYNSADFDAHLQAMGGKRLDANTLAGRIATDQALGIIPLDFDKSQLTHPDTSGILGIYDPQTQQIAVRGADISVYTRKTLVHELTHALQDQHFDLKRFDVAGSDDGAMAQRALIEGDARRIELGWTSTLSLGEQDLLERQARQNGDEAYPSSFVLGFQSFPYVVGNLFTSALLRSGKQAALDNAFFTPPVSTKQIIQPDAFARGEAPKAVPAPAADGAVVDQGTIGQFELLYVLAHSMSLGDAVVLSADWAGSHFVTWLSGTRPCIRVNLETTTPEGADAMTVALQAWAGTQPGRTVTGKAPISVTACA